MEPYKRRMNYALLNKVKDIEAGEPVLSDIISKFLLVSLFNGISTFVSYLNTNPSL